MKKLSLMFTVGLSLLSLVRIDASVSSQVNSYIDTGVEASRARLEAADKRLDTYYAAYKAALKKMGEVLNNVANIRATDDGANICLRIPLQGSDELSRAIVPQEDARGTYLVIPFNSGEIVIRENLFIVRQRQQSELGKVANTEKSGNEYEDGSAKRIAAAVSYGTWARIPEVNPSAARIKRDTDYIHVTLPLKRPCIAVEDLRSQKSAT